MSNGETDVEKRIREMETACAAHQVSYASMTMRMDDHEARMREIEKLLPALRAVMWAGSILAGSVVIFIWSIITGQVTIVFP